MLFSGNAPSSADRQRQLDLYRNASNDVLSKPQVVEGLGSYWTEAIGTLLDRVIVPDVTPISSSVVAIDLPDYADPHAVAVLPIFHEDKLTEWALGEGFNEPTPRTQAVVIEEGFKTCLDVERSSSTFKLNDLYDGGVAATTIRKSDDQTYKPDDPLKDMFMVSPRSLVIVPHVQDRIYRGLLGVHELTHYEYRETTLLPADPRRSLMAEAEEEATACLNGKHAAKGLSPGEKLARWLSGKVVIEEEPLRSKIEEAKKKGSFGLAAFMVAERMIDLPANVSEEDINRWLEDY